MNARIGREGGLMRPLADRSRDAASAELLSVWEAGVAAAHPGPDAPLCRAAGQVTGPEDTVEAEVVRCLPGALALVRTSAGTQEISLVLVAARAGDEVLVHDGEAIGRVGAGAPRTGGVG
jgi:hypothetical protein